MMTGTLLLLATLVAVAASGTHASDAAAAATASRAVDLWIGSNDVLFASLSGDASRTTPAPLFDRTFTEVVERLSRTGATLVVANAFIEAINARFGTRIPRVPLADVVRRTAGRRAPLAPADL